MKKIVITMALAGSLALSACEDMNRQDAMVVGALAGATAGVITAKALNVNDDWLIVAGLAGATVGTLVARNSATDECAYARGDGTYRIAPCPR